MPSGALRSFLDGSLYNTCSVVAPSGGTKGVIVEAVVESVWPMIATGAVRPVIGRRFPIEAAGEAHRALAAGETFGKVLLDLPW